MARGDRLKLSSGISSSYKRPFHEKPFFHYLLFIVVIATLVVSSATLYNVYQLKQFLVPTKIDTNDFLAKLTSHDEMGKYGGVAPLNVIQITRNNIANLQTQITSLDTSYIGAFLVQYTDAIVIYDYNNDMIKGTVSLQQQSQLPDDLFTKLNAHSELQGLEDQQPIGGQLDEASLNTLKQQFPDVYADAKVGDFILRYQTRLVIYDYDQDKIVNSVDVG